jgi:succinate dehydrogenase / fumarate reductase, cytochrome b subunit
MAQTLSRGPVSGTAVKKGGGKRKPFLVDLYSTAVGKKYVMAITGIVMIGFVVVHMIGNLKMFQEASPDGAYQLDAYGIWLRELLYPGLPKYGVLWILRAGLLAAVLLHIHAAYGLTMLNRKARPVKYQSARDYEIASFASRTMRWTGIIVLLFIIWHLLDFTIGTVNPGFEYGEVQRNVVASLSRIPVAIFYILANIALGIHLFHGTWSLFQSIGWNNPRFNAWRRPLATAVATIVVVGNVAFPIAVLAGIVTHPSV